MNPETVALIYRKSDHTVYDEAFNWETALNYAMHEPEFYVVVVKGDGPIDKASFERMIQIATAERADCFGN